jgi:hypothetical protein
MEMLLEAQNTFCITFLKPFVDQLILRDDDQEVEVDGIDGGDTAAHYFHFYVSGQEVINTQTRITSSKYKIIWLLIVPGIIRSWLGSP